MTFDPSLFAGRRSERREKEGRSQEEEEEAAGAAVSHSAGGGRWVIQSLAAASRTRSEHSGQRTASVRPRLRSPACGRRAGTRGAHAARESARVTGNSWNLSNIRKIHRCPSLPLPFLLLSLHLRLQLPASTRRCSQNQTVVLFRQQVGRTPALTTVRGTDGSRRRVEALI